MKNINKRQPMINLSFKIKSYYKNINVCSALQVFVLCDKNILKSQVWVINSSLSEVKFFT